MAAPEKVDQSRLEEALMRWNRGADAAYPELEELFEQARRDLRRLSTVLSESRAIPARLAITSGAGTPESQAAAVERLEGMEETLAAFHVELQTLLAQLRRTIQSGRDLAADLAALRQEEVPALTGLDALEQYEFGQQPGRSSQEEELEAQVKTLENALGAVRNRLLEAESRVKDAATIPNEVQEELINLRHEVAELRANRDITQALLTPEQEKQLEESIRAQAYDEAGKRRPMGLILVNAGVITREQLEAALREQQIAISAPFWSSWALFPKKRSHKPSRPRPSFPMSGWLKKRSRAMPLASFLPNSPITTLPCHCAWRTAGSWSPWPIPWISWPSKICAWPPTAISNRSWHRPVKWRAPFNGSTIRAKQRYPLKEGA